MYSSTSEGNIAGTFDVGTYNSLMDLGQADAHFREASEMDQFFHEAGTLILDHKLEAIVGICLLHKHNLLRDGEVMIEQLETMGDRPALIMARQSQGTQVNSAPVIWKLASDQQRFSPIEYSTTETAHASHERLMAASGFFRDFQALLVRYGYQDLIGVAVRRAGELKCSEEESVVERCHPTRIANVLTAERVLPEDESRMIRTNWSFERKWLMVSGQVTTKCVPGGRCESYCQATGSGQEHLKSHQGEKWHETVHEDDTDQ